MFVVRSFRNSPDVEFDIMVQELVPVDFVEAGPAGGMNGIR